MAYSTNIYLPNVRRTAVSLVLGDGWSMSSAARHVGESIELPSGAGAVCRERATNALN